MALPVLDLPADITQYLAEITSEHNEKPRFVATVSITAQHMADTALTEQYYFYYFDLDQAVGYQLDCVGEWVGANRILSLPQGITQIPDDQYRVLLRAVIAANHWDGTIPGAYDAWAIILKDTPFTFLIQDYPDGEMAEGIVGPYPPDPILQALFTSGKLDIKPAGIRLWHVLPSVWPAGLGGAPIFGLDANTPVCAGLDVSVWGIFFQPE
jgi:hypothetical protein